MARANYHRSVIGTTTSVSIHVACIIALIARIVPAAPAQTHPVTDCDHWDRFLHSLISVGTVASPTAATAFSRVFTSHAGMPSSLFARFFPTCTCPPEIGKVDAVSIKLWP